MLHARSWLASLLQSDTELLLAEWHEPTNAVSARSDARWCDTALCNFPMADTLREHASGAAFGQPSILVCVAPRFKQHQCRTVFELGSCDLLPRVVALSDRERRSASRTVSGPARPRGRVGTVDPWWCAQWSPGSSRSDRGGAGSRTTLFEQVKLEGRRSLAGIPRRFFPTKVPPEPAQTRCVFGAEPELCHGSSRGEARLSTWPSRAQVSEIVGVALIREQVSPAAATHVPAAKLAHSVLAEVDLWAVVADELHAQ